MESDRLYDLVIVGAGPAGLTASIYASCFHLKHLIIGENIGGQLMLAPDILNYPGFNHISGKELTKRLTDQAKEMGGELIAQSVNKISKNDTPGFILETANKNLFQTKALILATGTERRKLNIPGEVEYTARGVHYCATCEQQDYDDKICAVIGGANSAVQAAVEIARAAKKVFIIYRGSQLRGDPIWLAQIDKNKNIEVIFETKLIEILGDGNRVEKMKLQSVKGSEEILPVEKVFVEIGGVPGTALVIPLGVKMDPGGYIIVDDKLATNIPGIYAAGDLVSYGLSIEQISTAVGLGARAAASVFAYLNKEKAPTLWGRSQIRR